MEYKIISTDFDGTLLTSDKRVSSKNKNTLLKYKNQGYIIVGITARNLPSVKSKVDIEIFDYVILNNGGYVYDVKKEDGYYVKIIDRETITKIVKHFKDICQGIDYISINKYYMFRNNGLLDHRHFVQEVESFDEIFEPICRMNIMANNMDDLESYKDYLDQNIKEIDSIIMCDTDDKTCRKWIAINPKGFNKFTGLKELCEKLNVDSSQVIFFGDSANDIEIIKNVGLGVAMENALPEVKEIAKEVTLTNDDDGVAYFLEKVLMG